MWWALLAFPDEIEPIARQGRLEVSYRPIQQNTKNGRAGGKDKLDPALALLIRNGYLAEPGEDRPRQFAVNPDALTRHPA